MELEQFLNYNFLTYRFVVFFVMHELLDQFNIRKKSEHLC